MTEQQAPVPAISKGRLEFLIDGVFAIALTILVLELKVPELVDHRSAHELAEALADEASTFRSYLLSFAVLGLFWHRHTQQYRHYRVITRGMLVLHFVQLAAAASFPFCAALLGRYPTNRLSLVVYLACVLVYVWVACAIWILAGRSGALDADFTAAAYHHSRRRWLGGCLFISALFSFYLIRTLVSW